jgi:translocation and assembly module TamA
VPPVTAGSPTLGPGLARAVVVACLLLLAGAAAAAERDLRVTISGVSGAVLTNVRAYLTVVELADQRELEAERVRRAHRQARAEIGRALQAFGHYRPTIRARLETTDAGWVASYRVEPGPVVRIRDLEIRVTGPGAGDPALRQVLADSPLKRGEPLRHADYRTTKRRLVEAAVEAGYLDAAYRTSRMRIHPRDQAADIHLVLATGPAYHFGDIRVVQDILDPDLVRRMVPVRRGQRLTSRRLLALQFALSDSGYFRRINVDVQRARAEPEGAEPAPDQAPAALRVPVVVQTSPRPPRSYRFGMGYGTDTGPRFSAGLELRRLNRAGHRFRTDLMLSAVRQSLGARYQIPVGDVRTDRLSFTGDYQRAELGDGISQKYSAGISHDRQWRAWQRSFYSRYSYERFEFSDGVERSWLLTPGASLSRTSADDILRTHRGWSAYVDVHGAYEGVLAHTSFAQVRARLQGVLGIGSHLRLLARAEAGANVTGEFDELPASERFFAGGDRSVRGYAYQSLAPEEAGDVVGGQYLTTGSLEADLRVIGNWGVAAFYDAGNAGNQWPPEPVAGAGGGLRWFSPIGTIRLDYAVPLDAPNRAYRIHFSMGPDL